MQELVDAVPATYAFQAWVVAMSPSPPGQPAKQRTSEFYAKQPKSCVQEWIAVLIKPTYYFLRKFTQRVCKCVGYDVQGLRSTGIRKF